MVLMHKTDSRTQAPQSAWFKILQVHALHFHGTTARHNHTVDHAQQSSFAGATWPQQSYTFATSYI
jgi:hypothetical protein